MALWYIIVFVLGILFGILLSCLPIKKQRRRLKYRSNNRLDDVDEMMLWGMVADDPFYKGE